MPANQPFRKIQQRTIGVGVLMTFQYTNYKNDPSPLMLVAINGKNPTTHLWANGLVAGLNFHYLTPNVVNNMMKTYVNNPSFGYKYIKSNSFIVNAWRSYYPSLMKFKKIIDKDFLLQVLKVVRTIDPSEVDAIRAEIKSQLKQSFGKSAQEMTDEYRNIIGEIN